MQAVAVFNIAARYAMSWQTPPALEMRFDEKIVIRGRATAFTNPAIEAGIMHCRALLEFLGLRCDRKDPARLAQRLGKMEDDFVIEDFVGPSGPLSKVSVEQALMPYPGPKEEAEMALASVIHAANKGIAHMTSAHD